MPQNISSQPEQKIEINRPEITKENISAPTKTVEIFGANEQERVTESAQKTEKNDLTEKVGEGELGLVIGGQANSAAYQKRLKKIEETLEKDLSELYLAMPDNKKQEFKKVGEETADKINQMLGQAKYKIQNIIALIKKWLSLLPGASQFFIEQEAKIKTDEIVRMKE